MLPYSPIFRSIVASLLRRFMPTTGSFVLLISILTVHPAQAQHSHFMGRVVAVETGDRIIVRLDAWNITIQLHGVMCPTRPEKAALRAEAYTDRRIMNSDVQVQVRGTGPHETIYGEVRTYDGKSLNDELVGVGLAYWAKAYAPNRSDIARLESEARAGRRGIWGDADASNVALPPAPPSPTPPPTPSPVRLPTSKPSPVSLPATKSPQEPQAPQKRIRRHQHANGLANSPAAVAHLPVAVSATPIAAQRQRTAARTAATASLSPLLIVFVLVVLAALLAFGAQILLSGGSTANRLPFQIIVACAAGGSVGLLAPLPLLLAANDFEFSRVSLASAIVPPLIGLCAFASVSLCRREQIRRAAPIFLLGEAESHGVGTGLVRVRGITQPLPENEPFVSQVGRVSAIYLKETTYSYDAVQTEAYYSQRKRRGKRNTRYAWNPIYNEVSKGPFQIVDDSGRTATVDGDNSAYVPLRIARFYNDVPVESWFSRPYPGDTKTEVEFIATNAPVVVWGRPRRRATNTSGGTRESIRIGDDPQHNLLVVEGDETRIWSRRPLLGFLLILAALGLTFCLVYGLSTPGAFGSGGAR